MSRLRPLLKPLFWAALLFAYAAAIMPSDKAPSLSASDKVNHMIAFFTLALLAALAWPRMAMLRVAVLLAAFGALIEFTQAIPMLHRDASLWDWVADVFALGVGLAVARPVRRILRLG